MQESKIAIITPHTTSVVRLAGAGIYPALWDELCCLVSPQKRRAVDGPWRDVQFGAFGDLLCEDGGFSDGDAHGNGDCWVEAENFVADCGEVRERFENGGNVDVRVRSC